VNEMNVYLFSALYCFVCMA